MLAQVSYDHEGCHVHLVDDAGHALMSVYEYRRDGTWQECRDRALEIARAKAAELDGDPPPEPETLTL